MIKSLEIKNFTSFEELKINFSSGINIIIGENGTGKTQLLKTAYALSSSSHQFQNSKEDIEVEDFFTNRLIKIFLPEELKLSKLSRCKTSRCSKIKADFIQDYSHDKTIDFDFSTRVKSLKLNNKTDADLYNMEPIFIPTKEVLSLYRGIVNNPEHKNYFESIFDECYFDITNQLAKEPKDSLEPRIQSFLEEITNMIQGRFEFKNSYITFNSGKYQPYADPKKVGMYFSPTEDDNISTHMVAEGFRKLGVLHRLIENSTLVPKQSGTLFWDEPESNMNPKLMKLIVEILIELSKKEQQVILTTHDYVLLKWFQLLSKNQTHITYHVLSRDSNSNQVNLFSTENYLNIEPNAIADTFSKLTDFEIVSSMGGLGQ